MTLELGRRLWFTIGALLVYRLGSYIPLPGIDQTALAQIFRSNPAGALEQAVSSSAVMPRFAIFALGLIPYLSAAFVLQLASIVIPALRALPRQGARGRRALELATIGLTIVFAAVQALGVTIAVENVPSLVSDPGWPFRLVAVLSMIGGTIFLVWLSGQITLRGVGNGLALILVVGIVLDFSSAIVATLEFGRRGILSTDLIAGLAVLAAALTGLIVFMECAQRRLPVVFPRRQVGARMLEGRSDLVVKLNAAGLIPAIAAYWLTFQAPALYNAAVGQGPSWLFGTVVEFEHGRLLSMAVYAAVIAFCAFAYTAFVLDPEQAAMDLAKHGGAIPGVASGEATAAHIDATATRTACLGAVYLVLLLLIPEILVAQAPLPFYFGSTSLLVVVCAALDLNAQLKNHALVMGGDQRP